LKARQQRADHRFIDQIPVRVKADAYNAVPHLALTRDLNPQGLAFRSTMRMQPGQAVEVTLPLATRSVQARGEIVHTKSEITVHGEVFTHGVRFDSDLPIDDRDAIELHCTQHAISIWRKRYRSALGLNVRVNEIVRNARSSARRHIELPANVTVVEKDASFAVDGGLLEELSDTGARLLLDRAVEPGARVSFEVPDTTLTGSGEVVFMRMLESPVSVRFSVGIRLDDAGNVKQQAIKVMELAS
jgi:hypothetical protein